jgi:gamma-glutamylcyclotransferase (GGCT)/AIG2-like uncharacterized protein YtfP
MARDSFHLFTYGSLKAVGPGAPAQKLLAGCDRVGEGSVNGILYDMGEFPALLLGGEDRVRGVIWQCPAPRLTALDAYEGTGEGLFRRVAVRVGPYPCWVYVAGPKLGPRLVPDARITDAEWIV